MENTSKMIVSPFAARVAGEVLSMKQDFAAPWLCSLQSGRGVEIRNGWLDEIRRELDAERNLVKIDSQTAMMTVRGVMWSGVSEVEEYFYGMYNTDRILKNMEQAQGMGIRQLIFQWDTPGGQARGNGWLAEQMLEVQAQGMEMISWVPDLCASAGYYCASATARIYARPSALVGSIGSMAVAVDSSGLAEKWGYKLTLYATGDLKGMGSGGVSWPKEWHEELARQVIDSGAEFQAFTMARRGLGEDSFRGNAFEARKAPANMVNGLLAKLPF